MTSLPVIIELRKLLAQATPGPWSVEGDVHGATLRQETRAGYKFLVDGDGDLGLEDAELIVAAVNALGALLDTAEAAEQLRAKVGTTRTKDGTELVKVISASAFTDLDKALAALGAMS